MKINELHLKNFRCFEDETFEFSKNITLIIGNNAKGKSTLLEGLAVALGGFMLGIPAPTIKSVPKQAHTRAISSSDVRRHFAAGREVLTEEHMLPCEVTATARVIGLESQEKILSWTRVRKKSGGRSSNTKAENIKKFSESLYKASTEDSKVTLPAIAYYGTGRLSSGMKQGVSDLGKANTALGYYYCLKPDAQNRTFHQWISHMSSIEWERQRPVNILKSVYRTIESLLPNATSAYFSREHGELVVEFGDKFFPFSDLSDGQRSIISLAADLAVRCAHLNQHLGENSSQNTPGVVLIDELDLFIHPSWQQEVLPNLIKTFPEIQFIITTHSPFILQSIKKGSIVNLDHLYDVDRSPNLGIERSVEDISEDIMGVRNVKRSKYFTKQVEAAEEYYKLLDNGASPDDPRVIELDQKLDELEEVLGDNPAYMALLKAERLKRKQNS